MLYPRGRAAPIRVDPKGDAGLSASSFQSTLIRSGPIATRMPRSKLAGMAMKKIYNTHSGAEKLGVSPSTVSRWARRLGVGKVVGRQVVLTSQEIAAIGKHCYRSAGNPNFGKLDEK